VEREGAATGVRLGQVLWVSAFAGVMVVVAFGFAVSPPVANVA
jgi:hypothetical protein